MPKLTRVIDYVCIVGADPEAVEATFKEGKTEEDILTKRPSLLPTVLQRYPETNYGKKEV